MIRTPSVTPTHIAGLMALAAGGFLLAQAQVVIPESAALPASQLDKSKPGFKVRVVQASNMNGELANSTARAENQLAGLLVDTSTGLYYANIANLASFNADGTYDEPGTIAYTTDTFPGIPGTEDHSVNIALEAITFVELAPGTYSMVVNSDDGFRVTAGNVYDRLEEIELGKYEGGRGAGDTEFKFTVTKAGAYGFRLVYEQGGGGFSVDWFTADVSDPAARTHLNEAGGLLSYRALNSSAVSHPAISAISPLNGSQGVAPSDPFTAKIKNGTTTVNVSTLKVFRNDVDVTAQAEISASGDTTTVRHAVSTLPDPLSQVRYKLTFADTATPPVSREALTTYTVGPYANYTLPAPIWLETFDTTQEGAVPTGWKLETPIELSGTEDLDDPSSDSYANFVVISRDRISALGAAGRWDGARRLNSPEAYINGQRVSGLIQTNFLYGESDTRGGSQVQLAYSPTINLTGKNDIYLVYNSIYEQNQDSLGAVEYSIDGGKTWLPVVYMIDKDDLKLKPDGTVDPEETLSFVYGDTAKFTDPVSGEESDGSYGSFIGAAKTTWKDLAPFISGRINDDANESKRIEKFRLPQADNQATVSLRIVQAGTGSWYFGVDNIGLYSITTIDPPTLTAQPASITRFAGTAASFTVGATGQQLSYKWQFNGADIPNATSATYEIPSVTAANVGEYVAIVTNPSGSKTSAPATLTVNALPTDNSTLRQGLTVYLPFDNNYNDISGGNHNGSAVGAPTFAAGKVGAGAVRVTNSRTEPGSYNFVTLGSNDIVPFGQAKDFTVGFWLKTERVVGDPAIVGSKDWGSGNNSGWVIGTEEDGRIEWNYRRTNADGLSRKDLDYTAEGNLLAKPEWTHVSVVWTINGTAETYYNGRLVDSQSIAPGTGDLSPADLNLNIGQDGNGAYTDGEWDGLLDEVAFWDRALTATEVATVFGYGYRGESFLADPPSNPTITYSVTGGQMTMNWQGTGFVLQENTSLTNTTGWTAVAGAGANSATVPVGSGVKFYRLMK